jgi:hypothetical protein
MPLTESIERLTFSEAFPAGDNVRDLARRIARFSYEQADGRNLPLLDVLFPMPGTIAC